MGLCIYITLSCFITVLGAINTDNLVQESRGTAFNNIISNYFTTDPFFKAKQKARLHLPHKSSKSIKTLPTNAKQDRMSSISAPNHPAPIRLKLGPPIQILPNLSQDLMEKRKPPPVSVSRLPQSQRQEKLDEGIVVGVRNDEVVVPAPLLVATGPNAHKKQSETNYNDIKNDNSRRQSFSQLISTSNQV